MAQTRRLYSERRNLVEKSREAMLSAVQIYNNPMMAFRSEAFIVLAMIAWTYMLHAFFRVKKVDYRYFVLKGSKKRFDKNADGSPRYWDLSRCIGDAACALDNGTKNNLFFLIGLRHQVEHKKAEGLDSYMSARYQACALNFNFYLKKYHGEKLSLDKALALSLQFGELDVGQGNSAQTAEGEIPSGIISYITRFDNALSASDIQDPRFAFRLLFTPVAAKRKGQADRVVEFIKPDSELAKTISTQYWVKEDREKPKLLAKQVIKKVRAEGYRSFGPWQHTQFWRAHNGKDPARGFGTKVVDTWYWYENWLTFILDELAKQNNAQPASGQ